MTSILPFGDGSPAQFASARQLLAAAGYTAEAVCQRTEAPAIEELRTLLQGRETSSDVRDALDVLIRLFIDGLPVPEAAVAALLPPPGAEALKALSLIDRHPRTPGTVAATVRLYPTRGLYIASDLAGEAPGIADLEELEPPDHVFSAITPLTGTFLSQLPSSPCERFLELCAGTGVAALSAAGVAEHAWAADITERSTRFAEFNARLNGLGNVSALRGDLYEPVRGRTFDRIAAHPPYVPATETRMVYRDAGEDGEEVIRRILSELLDHLEPGGRFYLTCSASDRAGAPLEQRIRDMIGERHGELDLLLVTHYLMSPGEYYGRLAASGRITFSIAEERTILFRKLGAEQIVYCSVVLQRHTRTRAPFTVRRERSDRSASAETEWFLRWQTRMAEEDVIPLLLDSRPRLLPDARLRVTHRPEQGEWKLEDTRVTVDYPFIRTVELSMNAAMLLSLCDGQQSVRDILRRIQEAGAITPDVPAEAFAEFIRELVTEGVLGIGGEPGLTSSEGAPLADGNPAQRA